MSSATTSPAVTRPTDEAHWARSGRMLDVVDVPPGAMNLNVDGQELFGALQGFGQLWQKTYRVRLHGVTTTPGTGDAGLERELCALPAGR